MNTSILATVVDPLFRRVGTFAAGYLVSLGVDGELANTAVAALAALSAVSFDLVLSILNDKGKGR